VTSHPYPLVWPADPVGWLSPAGIAAAWVAETGSPGGPAPESARSLVGHVVVQHGVTNPAIGAVPGGGSAQPRWAAVSRLFVAPQARGQGWGRALLAAAAAHAEADGRRLMLQVVGDDGPAIALYERLGWQLADRRIADWSTPAGLQPVLRTYLGPVEP
jgi:ribosomal protein S18 acetylase RimI-like enzyme